MARYDVEAVRRDFPILERKVNGYPLIYLDSGASTLKPRMFVDAISQHYLMGASNVHRGVHLLSEEATTAYEQARGKVQKLINAKSDREIIYTSGTTESLNIVARGLSETILDAASEIIVSELEHHSNIVPWQMAAERTGAKIRVLPINERGELDLEVFAELLCERTKVVAVNAVSNSLGTINPVKEIVQLAHAKGALVVVDGAQAIAHMKVDVQDWNCDFFCFSGHKLFSATGTGILYGKFEHLDRLPPYKGGGDMIEKVSFSGTTYAELPARLEAGTPHIAGFIGLAASIDYFNSLDLQGIIQHEETLLKAAQQKLSAIEGVHIIGQASRKIAIVSFVVEGIHAHDLGAVLNMRGIAVRTGHHCTMPVNEHFGVAATTRASFSIYNTLEEVDALVAAIEYARSIFL